MLVVPNGRHTIDATLARFNLTMKTVLRGTHPLTEHDLQPLYAQRSLLVGRPLFCVKVGGLFQYSGGWSWYQQISGLHRRVAQ